MYAEPQTPNSELKTSTSDLLIAGAGVFGLTAAIELHHRGYRTTVIAPAPIPHPLAASTDISKIIRMEYGPDEQYMAMAEGAMKGWRAWNETFPAPLFHETGVTMVTTTPMAPGEFEYESYQLLLKRGHSPERLDADEVSRRHPVFRSGVFVDGFYHAQGGYAESGRVIGLLYRQALEDGIAFVEDRVVSLEQAQGRIQAAKTASGARIKAGNILVASGAWSPVVVPSLLPLMKASGHPVFHIQPAGQVNLEPPALTVFTGDISKTGWYGFPLHPSGNVVKLGVHGPGLSLHPDDDERVVTAADKSAMRAFLSRFMPALEDARLVYTRRCLYADTKDEHFLIDWHPEIKGLMIAAGGSGHGFKFAPIFGSLIADVFERKENSWLKKFAWREMAGAGEEAARFRGR